MAVVVNSKGTSFSSYQIGKGGVTLYQGTIAPSNGTGIAGDLYMYANGSTSTIYQKQGATWIALNANAVTGPLSSTNNGIATFSGTNGIVIQDTGVVIDANKTLIFSKNSGNTKRNQYIIYNTTTNNIATQLFLDGVSAQVTLGQNTSMHYAIQLVGRRTDTTGNNFGAIYRGMIIRDVNVGTTTLIGNPEQEIIINPSTLPWIVAITADTGNGALKITVTGETGKTIHWSAVVDTVEVT